MRLAGSEPATTSASAAPRGFLAGLSLAQLISWGSTFYLFGLLVQPIEAALQINRAQSSLGFSLMLLAEGTAAFPVGRWIDRGHARWVMSIGSVLVALCLLAHTQVTTLVGFYAVWLCLGLSLSCVLYTPIFAVVTRRFPLDFRRAIITLTFLGGLASTVFVPLIQWLILTFGWRNTVLVMAAFHLLVCLPLHWHFLRGEPKTAPKPDGLTEETADLQSILRSRVFWLIAIFSTLGMAVTASIPAHLVPLLQEQGLPGYWVVMVPAGIGVIQVLGRLMLYRLEVRFNLHRVNLMIVLLMPVSLAVLCLMMWAAPESGTAGPAVLALALSFTALFGLANGMMTIVKGTAIAQYVDRQHVASLNGVLGLPQAIGRALTPALVGALWGVSHNYGWGVAALLLGSLLSCGAFAWAQHLALKNQRK
jgi:MFS family permease